MYKEQFVSFQNVDAPPIMPIEAQQVESKYNELWHSTNNPNGNRVDIEWSNKLEKLPEVKQKKIQYKQEESTLGLKPLPQKKYKSQKEFVSKLYPVLYRELQNQGIDPNTWAPILTAQTAIESGWGNQFSTSINNYGGIKGKGSGLVETKEWSPKRGYYTIKDSFKSYNSVEDFAVDFVSKLKTRFKAFSNSPSNYISTIRNHGYFTAKLEDYQNLFNSTLQKVNSYLI